MNTFTEKACENIIYSVDRINRVVVNLPKPELFPLDRGSAIHTYAVIAVDTGQSLFDGLLSYLGILLFQVATSDDSPPKPYVFYTSPYLNEVERETQVRQGLEALLAQDPVVKDFASLFTQKMGYRKIYDYGVMPERCFTSAAELASFLRELVEWAALYDSAKRLNRLAVIGKGIIQPVVLRDGVLRFDAMGKGHSDALRKMFRELDIPIIGITKRSAFLRNPIVSHWLEYHRVFTTSGPFAVRLSKQAFEELGYRLEKYFGEGGEIRFGGSYILVRFDPLPGSHNLFVVDIPDYLIGDWQKVLFLLSGISYQGTATVYPVPGYPLALSKAHEKAHLTNEHIKFLEASIKEMLPPSVYNFLKLWGF